jgi:hypothetical protein
VHHQVASATKAGVGTVWLDDLGVKCKDRARESEAKGWISKEGPLTSTPATLGLASSFSSLHHSSTSRHVLLFATLAH